MMNHQALLCHFIVCIHKTEIIKTSNNGSKKKKAKKILISGLGERSMCLVHEGLSKSDDNRNAAQSNIRQH